MNKVLHFVYIIVIIVLLVTLIFYSKRQIEGVESRVTDTILKIRVDTFTEYIPKYVTKKTTDTIYLPSNDKSEVALEIEQFHFSKEGAYDAWISGYNPSLDSIKTYPRVEYRTITNNITKEIEINRLNIYPYMGINNFNGSINPTIGIAFKMPKNTMYMGEIGSIDGKMYYGLKIGFMLK